MAHDVELAERVRRALGRTKGITERQMFGGLCFMLDGNMTCGLVGDTLMLRVGPAEYESCLALPHAREMDFTGRPLRGYVYVAPEGIRSPAALQGWIARATRFVSTLPPKPASAKHR